MTLIIQILGAIGAGAAAAYGIMLGYPGDIVPQEVLLATALIAGVSTVIATTLGASAANRATLLTTSLTEERVRASVLESSATPTVIKRAEEAVAAITQPPAEEVP